ncbi:unnamed protein product [Rodentolepis nana]|uniref:YccF domain-containing protein n=1 Tax=Rodentolepis nana TaxID=102285 RepID=A0A0R3T7K4_RODNA|nr:unnamed protein product [Rodentolepis nana]
MADPCPGILYSILWALLIIFVAWPVAGFLAGIYVFLLPFGACITPLEQFLEQMLEFIKLPLIWAKKCVSMTPITDCSM